MDEELIEYLFQTSKKEGFKKNREDFVKYLQSDDELFDYLYGKAQKEGYKKDKAHFAGLVGRTTTAAPVATTEPAKTEVTTTTTTEPTKTEPTTTTATTTPAKTEPAKTEVVAETKTAPTPVVVAETKTEPSITVKEVEAPVKEEPKLKIKLKEVNTVPADVIERKGLFVSEDLKGIKLPKYKPEEIIDKKLLTENKESLGLKQFEDEELIFKKWLESKGMPLDTKEENLNRIDRPEYDKYRYNQKNNRIRAIVDSYLPYLMENKDKLSSEYQEKLREELTSPTFKSFVQGFRGDFYNYDKNNPNFKLIEKVNEEYWRDPTIYSHVKSQYGIKDGEKQELDANEFLQSPILNNSEKVITKFGPMFYDKENDTYYKYEYGILNAEPYIKYNLRKYPDYKVPLEVIKPGTEQHKLIKEGNKETWDGVDRTMYRGASVKKDGTMQVKEVTEQPKVEVKAEEPKKELPVSTGLTPITEKTEVKAVETPSDKMVIKSEKKGKIKVAPEPIKIEPIKVETKGGQIQVEVPTFAIPEPKKKYKPYGEKGPDVYYSEDFDQFIIKEGNERTVASKGSPKYAEIETKLAQAAGATKEGKGKCDTPPFVGCSPTKTALNEFLYYGLDDEGRGLRSTDEGGLIENLDNRKQIMEKKGESLWSLYDRKESTKGEGDFYYANEAPPKSDRFIVYKPYGNDNTLIYDKESNIILKQLDGKAPFVDAQSKTRTIYNTKGDVSRKGSDPKEFWRNYAKNNPNEGLTVWKAYEVDQPEYKELKSIIEGIDYKKAKGSKNTFIPSFNPVPETPEWQKQ